MGKNSGLIEASTSAESRKILSKKKFVVYLLLSLLSGLAISFVSCKIYYAYKIDDLIQQIKTKADDIEAKTKQIESLNGQTKNLIKQIEGFSDQIKSKNLEIENLNKVIESQKDEIDNLEKKLDECKNLKIELKNLISKTLKTEIKNESTNEDKKEEIQNLISKVNSCEETKSLMEEKVKEMEANQRKRIRGLESRLDESLLHNQLLTKKIDEINKENDHAQKNDYVFRYTDSFTIEDPKAENTFYKINEKSIINNLKNKTNPSELISEDSIVSIELSATDKSIIIPQNTVSSDIYVKSTKNDIKYNENIKSIVSIYDNKQEESESIYNNFIFEDSELRLNSNEKNILPLESNILYNSESNPLLEQTEETLLEELNKMVKVNNDYSIFQENDKNDPRLYFGKNLKVIIDDTEANKNIWKKLQNKLFKGDAIYEFKSSNNDLLSEYKNINYLLNNFMIYESEISENLFFVDKSIKIIENIKSKLASIVKGIIQAIETSNFDNVSIFVSKEEIASFKILNPVLALELLYKIILKININSNGIWMINWIIENIKYENLITLTDINLEMQEIYKFVYIDEPSLNECISIQNNSLENKINNEIEENKYKIFYNLIVVKMNTIQNDISTEFKNLEKQSKAEKSLLACAKTLDSLLFSNPVDNYNLDIVKVIIENIRNNKYNVKYLKTIKKECQNKNKLFCERDLDNLIEFVQTLDSLKSAITEEKKINEINKKKEMINVLGIKENHRNNNLSPKKLYKQKDTKYSPNTIKNKRL